MKRNSRYFIFYIMGLFAVLVLPPLYAPAQPPVEEVVDRIDKLYRADTSYVVMEMEITTPHWSRTLKMKAWTKGMNRTILLR
ncbi:MAG: hypothetical protein ACOC7U_10105 [Spirochaetota bacterium]